MTQEPLGQLGMPWCTTTPADAVDRAPPLMANEDLIRFGVEILRRMEKQPVAQFSSDEMIEAAITARAFTRCISTAGTVSARKTSAARLGWQIRRYAGEPIRLHCGSVIRIFRRRTASALYRVVVGDYAPRDETLVEMQLLLNAAAQFAMSRRPNVDSLTEPNFVYPLKKSELRDLCKKAGAFTWLNLDTPSGHSSFGLTLSMFDCRVFELPTGNRVRFSSNGAPGRAGRYLIDFL